jgi:hypothetical protein
VTRAALEAERRSRAGCIQLRRARSTGTLVGVYRAGEAGLEDEPGYPWATVCEEHATLIVHETRALAVSHAAAPEGWCEECGDQTAIDPRANPVPKEEA